MHLILIGPPGSGKGTQAKKLSEKFNLVHISTGDLLRKNPSLTPEQKEVINSGKLAPDEMMIDIVKKKLEECNEQGWILDGFPRTTNQANHLKKVLGSISPAVIYYRVNDEEIIERLSGRLSCNSCGSVFNKTLNPPEVEGICDVCQKNLIQRKDDDKETVAKRLSIYHESTAPIINFYESDNLLTTIDANNSNSINEIFNRTVKGLS